MYKQLKFIFTLVFIICYNTTFSQTTLDRKQLFDNNWKFQVGDFTGAERNNYNDKSWEDVDLPHDWSIKGKVHPDNPMGGDGGFFPSGIGWYRKRFTIPKSYLGKLISLSFEGVYMNSEVFINGKSLGTYPYGYTPFSYDLTKHLLVGQENVIAVKVDNSKHKNSRWYNGSGIYRHVWIISTDPVHIPDYGIRISTPKIAPDQAVVKIATKVKNQSDRATIINVITKLSRSGSEKIFEKQSKVKVDAHGEAEVVQDILVSNPMLWSVASPRLYLAKISLDSKGVVLDQNTTEFGIRSLQFSVGRGFELNGKTIKINGGCVHHDNGILGAAAFDQAEIRKVKLLKEAGFNAVRTSHNIPSEAFLTACDRLGVLVIDEAFDGWREAKNKYDYSILFNQWWKSDIGTMVMRDRNHPSIIMWSLGNEIIERKTSQAVQTAKMLAEEVKRLDPTRMVTSAMTTWDKDWEIFDPLMEEHDLAGYNYQLHRAPADHQRVPQRIILQTESYPRDAFFNWKLVNENSYILGDFVWTAMDYLGESGIGRWYYSGEASNFHSSTEVFPWHGAYCGDIDLTGMRKPISHYRSMLYNDTERLYLAVREPNPEPLQIKLTDWAVWPTFASWSWPGFEGVNLKVDVYSKYPKVRLYLNGRLLGEKDTGIETEFKAVFDVPYTAGKLTAVGVRDGREIEEKTLITVGKAQNIVLKADKHDMHADGQDLIFITLEVSDDEGVLDPNAADILQLSINGPGKIIGFGNASLKDIEPYSSVRQKLWKGRAMVIIRSTLETGNIELNISSKTLNPVTCNFKSF